MTETRVSETLNRAADLIEERGWTKGPVGMSVKGPHCALGSIAAVLDAPRRASGERFLYLGDSWGFFPAHPILKALSDYLGAEGWSEDSAIYEWNDTSDRTAAEVVETLRACALIEAAKENTEARTPVSAL